MVKKIIVVGSTTQNNKFVNGQSMMFQLLIDQLRDRKVETKLVDYGRSISPGFSDKRISGKFSFIKLFDNFLATFHYIFILARNPRTNIYINTAQSKIGFIRDYVFINLAKLFKRKIVAHQFGANYEHFFNAQSQAIQKKIKSTLEKTDFFIVEGDYTRQQLSFLNDFEKKVVSIPNGLPEKIDIENNFSKEIDAPVTLLYLSNLIEGKGYWDVLEAANILSKQYQVAIEVFFVGKFLTDLNDSTRLTPAEAEAMFFRKIKEYNLEEKVKYCPGLYGVEKAKMFKKAHFFILPSYYINEGQPASVLEAIAYGCVPVVTKYRLIPTMVNESNGFFVDKKSPEQIAQAIVNCVNDPALYKVKSTVAIEYFKQNFTAEKYVDRILNLFDEIAIQA